MIWIMVGSGRLVNLGFVREFRLEPGAAPGERIVVAEFPPGAAVPLTGSIPDVAARDLLKRIAGSLGALRDLR